MIHDVLFSILGIAWIVLLIYLQMRSQGIVIHIDRRHPLKLKWKRYPSGRQIREVSKSNDEQLRVLAKKYKQNDRAIWLVLFGGLVLMGLIQYLFF